MLSGTEISEIYHHLVMLPNKLEQLEIQLTRQSQFGSAYADGGKNAGEKPLYFDNGASEARHSIDGLIAKYCKKIIQDWPVPHRIPLHRDRPRRQFLMEQIYSLRPYDEAFTEFDDAVKEINRVIDIPRMRIYLGDCWDCSAKLYGDPEADVLVCPKCSVEYDPSVLREANQKRGEDMKVTARQAREYIGEVLGIALTQGRFNNWTRRGYMRCVAQHPVTQEKIYRLGDVIACVRQRAKESGDRSVRT